MSPPRVRIGDVVAIPGYVNWLVIIHDIRTALGIGQGDVADLLNVPRTTLARWIVGFEPGYGYGEAVMQLHTLACGAEKTLMRTKSMKERATRAATEP